MKKQLAIYLCLLVVLFVGCQQTSELLNIKGESKNWKAEFINTINEIEIKIFELKYKRKDSKDI